VIEERDSARASRLCGSGSGFWTVKWQVRWRAREHQLLHDRVEARCTGTAESEIKSRSSNDHDRLRAKLFKQFGYLSPKMLSHLLSSRTLSPSLYLLCIGAVARPHSCAPPSSGGAVFQKEDTRREWPSSGRFKQREGGRVVNLPIKQQATTGHGPS
jgi:hypothetical protein